MKKILITLTTAVLLVIAASGRTINFDKAQEGKVPAGWRATMSGTGDPEWSVEKDASPPSKPHVFKQSGTAAYPLCIKEGVSLRNGFVEVKFKALSGKKDQAAGIIWRCKDAQNYYVVRANALEDNVVLYKMHNGKRSSLDIVGREGGYGVDIEVPLAQWGTLRIEFLGTRHSVFLNGKKIFEVEDDTFTDPGMVGLWTKADSVTLFDNFSFGKKTNE